MTENDVDPEDPRPEGHYPRFRDNTWYYVPDELAQTISLGPGEDGQEGQDWVLTFTPERRDESDREKVLVRLTPRALHELWIEVKDLSNGDIAGARADLSWGEKYEVDERTAVTAGRSRTRSARADRTWTASTR